MRHKILVFVSVLTTVALAISSCAPQPTPDVAAISTVAAQTVEARFTALAAESTATLMPPTATTAPAATIPPVSLPTETPVAGMPEPTSNGKACYAMTFVSDITIPDGMIIAPGARFTKTWRVRNDGNCVWDQKYALVLDKGDALSSVTSFPLTRVVNPGDTYDITVELTAPTKEGDYAGYWRIATPFGGFMGVGSYNQSLSVQIKVASKPDRAFDAVSVVYSTTRRPATGCGKDGAEYEFTATITANGPGEMNYRWDRNPFDGKVEGGVLKFTAAGSQTVSWTWRMTMDHPQGIDRWIAITTIVDTKETYFDRVMFNYTCQ